MPRQLTCWLSLLCLCFSAAVWAGGVRIDKIEVNTSPDGFRLVLASRFSLDEDVTEALDNGITLVFEIESVLQRQRRLWPDDRMATSLRRFTLSRHALSERYALQEDSNPQARTFKTIQEALTALGAWEELLPCKRCGEHPDSRYLGRTRVRLITDELPAPMRPLIWISPAWWVSSGWQAWEVQP